MAEFTEYLTMGGDRWDLIAHYAYGDFSKFPLILSANPTVPITAILPAGIRLLIPILTASSNTPQSIQLPPWKR